MGLHFLPLLDGRLVVSLLVVDDVILAELDGVIVVDSHIGQTCILLNVVGALHAPALAVEHVAALAGQDALKRQPKQSLVKLNGSFRITLPSVLGIVELH